MIDESVAARRGTDYNSQNSDKMTCMWSCNDKNRHENETEKLQFDKPKLMSRKWIFLPLT